MSTKENQPEQQQQTFIVFVGNLNGTVTSRDLAELAADVGPVNSTVVCFDADGNPLGHGFVEFTSLDDANVFIEDNNGRECCETILNCSPFVPDENGPNPLRSNTLFLTNFPANFGKDDIDGFIAENCPENASSDVFQNQDTGVIYAFVTFDDSDQVLAAVDNLHGHEFEVEDGDNLNLYADIVQVNPAVRKIKNFILANFTHFWIFYFYFFIGKF